MTLVLLHGFTGDESSWDDVVRLTAASTLPMTPLLLGHDLGPDEIQGPDEHGFADEVDRLARRIQDFTAEPVHLAGYSLGGRLALGLAAAHRARVARLTLISVHPGLASASERGTRVNDDERWARMLEDHGIRQFADRWAALPLFASQQRLSALAQARERVRRLVRRPAGLALSLRRNGLGRMPPLSSVVAQLPTVLLTGGDDPKLTALARTLDARHQVVPGAGHNLLIEAPAAVAAALKETP